MACLLVAAIAWLLGMICLKVKVRAVETIAIERAALAHYASWFFAAVMVLSLIAGALTGI